MLVLLIVIENYSFVPDRVGSAVTLTFILCFDGSVKEAVAALRS